MAQWDIGSIIADRYALTRKVGEGGSASTFLAKDLSGGAEVTLKVARASTENHVLAAEFSLLAGLYHPHLARAHDLFVRNERVVLVSAWVPGESLRHEGASAGWETAADIASALAFLHAMGLAHGDVKAENIIVCNGRATLIDLGTGKRGAGATHGFTPATAAPETVARGEASFASDVYGLARTFVDVLGGRTVGNERLLVALSPALSHNPHDRPEARDLAERLGCDLDELGLATLRSRFIGRDAELARLAQAVATPGARVVVTGPAAIGKSRLLHEARWHAAIRGATSARQGREALLTMLARAFGAPLDAGLSAILDAAERRTPEPHALFVDDADQCSSAERAVLAALHARRDLPFVLVASARTRLPEWEESSELRLVPLTPMQVEELVRGTRIDAGDARAALGNPGAIIELSAPRTGSMLAEASTSDEERRILALAAASLGAVSEEQVLSFGGSADALASLVLRGMLARTGADFVTARAPTTTALPPGLIREAHVYLARISASAEERIFHVASGGDHAGARALLPAMSPLVSAPPPALYDLARRLALVEDGRLRAFAAEVLERAGDTRASTRALLALVLRRHDVQRERARLVLGRLLTRRGDLRALRVLRACALPEARVEETIALLKLGRFGEAVALAERAMAEPNASPFRTDLEISQALGRSFAGEIDGQFPQIRAACESPPAAPRTRFRLWNAAATIALRAGKNHEARSFYVRALGEARTHGLSDLTLSATVNLAVADHQAKELGAALHGYRRAQDLARASNNDATLAMVTLYRARLFADLRSWKRAAFEVDQLSGRTLSPVHQASRSYIEAELGLARGDHASARRLAEDAIRQCAHAPRERAEAGVLRLAVEIAAGEDDAHALRLADALDDESRLLGAEDVSARLHCLRTELSMRRGRDDEAARHARTALLHADRSERRSLQAEAHALLARVYEKSGALAAARPHTEAATRLEEEHWSELPVELRPPRPPGAIRSAHDAGSRDGQALARALLKVFAAHDSGDAHARAVEEAISLTRAERGFLLLRGESSPVVAAAKNVDQEAIKKPRQKYGRSIAQKVMEHGESILMVDAQTDANVPQGTAHRLGLRSVLCVPLFTKARATGALYLDNRFADGAFTEADERAVRTLAEALASLLIRFDAEDALAAEVVELRRLPRPVPAPVSPALPTSGHAMVSPFPEITTRSQALLGALEPVARVADVDVPVLIRGESGTGKELVARAIHAHGARRAGPFVAINCGALPETLLEAELFGYVRGAFTGANQDKDGLFVAAQKGTLFLDELGEMPLSMQVKLLRVLQEREVRPVGGTKQVPLDVRVVCATNRDLRKEIAEGRFREDLYYRVAVVDVLLPPLRERAMDVPYLADAFMQRLVRETGLSKRLAPEAVSALLRHDWPGNVRELENAIVRAFFLADGVVVSEVPGLGKEGTEQKRRPRKGDEERRALASALEENEWNVRQVARMLGIPRATFYRKLARYGLARTPP